MQDCNPTSPQQEAALLVGAKDFDGWMRCGTDLHLAGQVEQALIAFENALTLAPQDVNAASACATMLSLLDRPQAAYSTLLSVEKLLMETADGAANLAIAAEACGDLGKAQAGYAQALQLAPDHLRALNNVGILAASASQWDVAIGLARKCVELQPGHPPHHANLSEFLSGAGLFSEALEVVASAMTQFPEYADLKIRHIALLAFNGELEKVNAALNSADQETRRLLDEFLLKMPAPENLRGPPVDSNKKSSPATLDALDIHIGQAARSLSVCDWRSNSKLTALIRSALSNTADSSQRRDWNEAAFFAAMLELREEEVTQIHRESMAATGARLKATLPPFVARRNTAVRKKDVRIHVGLAVPSLHDASQVHALKRQLVQHDDSRFAMHVYAFTRQPQAHQSDALRPHAVCVAELDHMLEVEAAARMRLDQLDVYVELGGDFGGCPREVAAWRVAPVQLRHFGWDRHHVPGHWDYSISDRFIHQEDSTDHSPIARLPHTCWLATHGDEPPDNASLSRAEVGLPADALVLSSFLSPATLDPHSFSVWMKILRSLPDAVLWLPHCGKAATHLVREAQAAGVGASRLLFSSGMGRSQALAGMKLVDLVLDPLRFSAAQGLEDALRLGIPAISCAGQTMASRLGGSILQAAGLPECVFDSPEAYVTEALRLGRDAGALQQLRERLRERLQAARPSAALFDLASRVQEWEAAWTTMVERSRAGLAPAAFDVPSTTSAPAVTP